MGWGGVGDALQAAGLCGMELVWRMPGPRFQLQQAYCELNRRTEEHEECGRRDPRRAELTLQASGLPLGPGLPRPACDPLRSVGATF